MGLFVHLILWQEPTDSDRKTFQELQKGVYGGDECGERHFLHGRKKVEERIVGA